jgi:3-oxoacyl-[acyl-carrier protein] reductase
MNITLHKKRALVCGSTQGIGKAIAELFASMGAEVVLCARSEESLKTILASLPRIDGTNHSYIVADFANPNSVREQLEAYCQTTNKSFDIVINNTGGPAGGAILNASDQDFLQTFAAHLLCSQNIAQVVVPAMKEKNFGRIINIISTSVKQPLDGLGVSNTIRGAMASWAKTLANELAPFGITVNNVLPGATMTSRLDTIIKKKSSATSKSEDAVSAEMMKEIPAGRFAHPEEIAFAVGFLASENASYITGINLPVDGGRLKTL